MRFMENKKLAARIGIITTVITIVGMALLLVPQWHTAYFWMAWVVGGLLCGVVGIAVSTFIKDDPTA